MMPEFHQRMRQLFEQALEYPEAQRLAFVKTASGGDPALVEAVERLLSAQADSESFLENTQGLSKQIGRYLIRRELGRGAMGIVYDATDPMISRRVAIKVISLKSGTDASDAEFLKDRLFREARSAGRLFHPGIVVILDVGQHDGAAFITMELVEGPSLQRFIASSGPPLPAVALGIVKQTADALDYAHRNGVIHRDIKPANIILQGGTTVKVADFGIAKLLSTQNQTVTGLMMGTPSYMSPEQVQAGAVDGRSDQFSLAVMAFELFTGIRPFQADSVATVAHLIVYGTRPSAHALNSSLPPAVDRIFHRGLGRFPDDRYSTCADFAAALEEVLQTAPAPETSTITIKQPVLAKGKKWSLPSAFYIGAAAALIVFAFIFFTEYFGKHPTEVALAKTKASAVLPAAASSIPKPSPLKFAGPPPDANPAQSTVKNGPADGAKSSEANSSGMRDKRANTQSPEEANAVHAQQLYDEAVARRNAADQKRALDLFRQSADLGNTQAMQELGDAYRSGELESKDGLDALRWFLKAAASGNSYAMLEIGTIYMLGQNVPEDLEAAAQWYQKAVDKNNPDGMFDLGNLYENGQGVPRDMNKAKELFKRAAEFGNRDAQRRLAELQAAK